MQRPETQGNRSCHEMMIPRKGERPSATKRGHSQRQKRGEKQILTDGRSWRQDVQERVTPRERQTDRWRESETHQKKDTRSRQTGRKAEVTQRDRDRDAEGERGARTEQKAAKKRGGVEAGVVGSGGRGAGAAERAGAGSRLVKAARSGEIAARIAELHKTPPARPAAEPAPISSLIAARAGYAFKCYLIGLRRSWGSERPPPPPRTLRTPGLLTSSTNLFSKSQIAVHPLPTRSPHPCGSPSCLGSFFCSPLPSGARGHSERHKSHEDA